MKNIILIGCGEVGSALKRVEEDAGNSVYVCELNKRLPSIKRNYDVMHVCIGYSPKFIEIVSNYSKKYNPRLIIVNSTVPPGTTEALDEVVDSLVTHSFVRGVHPNLYEGLKTFVKFVGGASGGPSANEHFKSLGLKTYLMKNCEESEIAKILDTTYYGWNILFAKMIKNICDKYGYEYEEVYKLANETYNKGYKKLGKSNVIRPVLTPPEGRIGGHCIVPNFHLLPEGKLKKICIELEETDEY